MKKNMMFFYSSYCAWKRRSFYDSPLTYTIVTLFPTIEYSNAPDSTECSVLLPPLFPAMMGSLKETVTTCMTPD